ncbi:TRAP transporter small permease protein [Thioclava sp. F1Mire-8]|uniref:TRAP transporter small permease n=1 Tax=Thioclava sp. F1Mire-8 TaxID=1973006 RepID=UPI000B53D413|nr:TRAP transporter small permease [Thioclava sp. F1Mire-8]OWX99650.1 TRAP transporter small permease protein [Thioclava sp. F1Mire-8]
MLARAKKLADRLIGLSAIIGTTGLIFVVAVIVIDVIGRNFGMPLYGSQDLITMTMVLIVFGGMALCDRRDGHIVVDIFESAFPRALNRAIDIFSALLGVAIFVLIAVTVYKSAQLSQMLNLSTNLLNLPNAWFQYALVALSLVGALTMCLRALRLMSRHGYEHHSERDVL